MAIKQSVINTFNRVGIDYQSYDNAEKTAEAFNRFTGESVACTPLVSKLINWVYATSNAYESGVREVNISDFDRVRYFILDQDSNAYMTCID